MISEGENKQTKGPSTYINILMIVKDIDQTHIAHLQRILDSDLGMPSSAHIVAIEDYF